MLRLALEIPTVMLERWAPLIDLDFVLAHKVLEDARYAQFFASRHEEREMILDNSTHEFGKPMPLGDLQRAVELTRANWLIAPDIVNPQMDALQYSQNLQWMEETCGGVKQVDIAAVLCGLDRKARLAYLDTANAAGVDMICFTFHMPQRLEWWREYEEFGVHRFSRVHLLGMISLDETRKWVELSERHPGINFSFDTSKPLKFGVQGRHLADVSDLRGGQIRSKEVLDLEHFTEEQQGVIEHNIQFLKAVCRGEA